MHLGGNRRWVRPWKSTPEFYKKEELEENSIYSFKPIEDMKLRGTE